MADTSQILVEPYGKAGPFGEVLWYLLSEVRTQFIRAWAKRIHALGARQASKAIHTLHDYGIAQCGALLKKLETEQADICDTLRDTWVWPEDISQCESAYAERIGQLKDYARRVRRHFEDMRLDGYVGEDDNASIEKIAVEIAQPLEECLWPYLFLRYESAEADLNITWLANLRLLLLPAPARICQDSLLYPSLRELRGREESDIFKSVSHWTDVGSHFVASDEIATREKLDIGHVRIFRDDHVKGIVQGDWLNKAPKRSRLSDWFYWNQSGARFCLDENGNHTESKDEVAVVFYWCCPLPRLLEGLSDILNGRNPDENTNAGTALTRNYLSDVIKPTIEAWRSANGPEISSSLQKRLVEHYRYLRALEESRRQLDFGAISHSIKNLFTKNRASDRESFERRIWLEQKMIDVLLGSVREIDWCQGYSPDIYNEPPESVTQTIHKAWNHQNHTLDLTSLEGCCLRSAVLPVVVEAVRNLNGHYKKRTDEQPAKPQLCFTKADDDTFSCFLCSCVTKSDAEQIKKALGSFHQSAKRAGSHLTGISTILHFVSQLSTDRSRIEWTLRVPDLASDSVDFIYCFRTQRKGRLNVIKQPHSGNLGVMEVQWTNLKITA